MSETTVGIKTLLIGVGNPILSDDAAGIRIARYLKQKYPDLDIVETSEYGIGMLDYVTGYDRLVIIDSIKTGRKTAELFKLELHDLNPSSYYPTSHGVDIATAFNLGRKLGYRVPDKVCIYAVEVEDNTTFAEHCTPMIEDKIPQIAGEIAAEERLVV